MFNIMPMDGNGIQAPSGEQPGHLENAICDGFEVWEAMEARFLR